jgi:hypothetical protein
MMRCARSSALAQVLRMRLCSSSSCAGSPCRSCAAPEAGRAPSSPGHQRSDPRQARRPGKRGMKGVVGGVEGGGILERDRVALGRDRNAEPRVVLRREAGLADPDAAATSSASRMNCALRMPSSDRKVTKFPRDGMVTISPSSLSHVIASRTGVRLAPNRAPVSASDSRVPGGSAWKGWPISSRRGSAAPLVDPGRCPGRAHRAARQAWMTSARSCLSALFPPLYRTGKDRTIRAAPVLSGRRRQGHARQPKDPWDRDDRHRNGRPDTMCWRSGMRMCRAPGRRAVAACGPRGPAFAAEAAETWARRVGIRRWPRYCRRTTCRHRADPDTARCARIPDRAAGAGGKGDPLEKPVGRNLAEAEEVVAICESGGRAAGRRLSAPDAGGIARRRSALAGAASGRAGPGRDFRAMVAGPGLLRRAGARHLCARWRRGPDQPGDSHDRPGADADRACGGPSER